MGENGIIYSTATKSTFSSISVEPSSDQPIHESRSTLTSASTPVSTASCDYFFCVQELKNDVFEYLDYLAPSCELPCFTSVNDDDNAKDKTIVQNNSLLESLSISFDQNVILDSRDRGNHLKRGNLMDENCKFLSLTNSGSCSLDNILPCSNSEPTVVSTDDEDESHDYRAMDNFEVYLQDLSTTHHSNKSIPMKAHNDLDYEYDDSENDMCENNNTDYAYLHDKLLDTLLQDANQKLKQQPSITKKLENKKSKSQSPSTKEAISSTNAATAEKQLNSTPPKRRLSGTRFNDASCNNASLHELVTDECSQSCYSRKSQESSLISDDINLPIRNDEGYQTTKTEVGPNPNTLSIRSQRPINKTKRTLRRLKKKRRKARQKSSPSSRSKQDSRLALDIHTTDVQEELNSGSEDEENSHTDSILTYPKTAISDEIIPSIPATPVLSNSSSRFESKDPPNDIHASSISTAVRFFHPFSRIQKDSGKGVKIGSKISASGRDAVLQKLQEKMNILAEVQSGTDAWNSVVTTRSSAVIFSKSEVSEMEEVTSPSAINLLKIRERNVRDNLNGISSNIRSSQYKKDGNKYIIETRSTLGVRMGFVSIRYGVALYWADGTINFVLLRKMCSPNFSRVDGQKFSQLDPLGRGRNQHVKRSSKVKVKRRQRDSSRTTDLNSIHNLTKIEQSRDSSTNSQAFNDDHNQKLSSDVIGTVPSLSSSSFNDVVSVMPQQTTARSMIGIEVSRARGLQGRGPRKAEKQLNPYVCISHGVQNNIIHKTDIAYCTNTPDWGVVKNNKEVSFNSSLCMLPLPPPSTTINDDDKLIITIHDHRPIGSDRLLGKVFLPLSVIDSRTSGLPRTSSFTSLGSQNTSLTSLTANTGSLIREGAAGTLEITLPCKMLEAREGPHGSKPFGSITLLLTRNEIHD